MNSMETVVDRLLDEATTEFGREDNKAVLVLAALTVATGALVAGFFAGGWRPSSLTLVGTAMWAAGGLALLLGLMFVGVAVMTGPRTAGPPSAGPQTFQSLLDEAVRRDGDPAGRLWTVRAALTTKRRLLGVGLALAGAGFGLCAAVGLAG